VVRHNAVGARGPCGSLAVRSPQQEGRRPSCENAQRRRLAREFSCWPRFGVTRSRPPS
jgi:hypothetical protein